MSEGSQEYSRNLMGGIIVEDVFHDQNGLPVFNGAFACEKRAHRLMEKSAARVFILGMVPANAYRLSITGD